MVSMRKGPFCEGPPPPAGGTRGRQRYALLCERHALVPEARVCHEVAQRPEILRIIGIELDGAHRLNPKQVGLASHPCGTGDESTNERIMRGNLDGAVC